MRISASDSVGRLPAYAVAEIANIKKRLIAEGVDVLDLGVGDADFPPPQIAVVALAEALRDRSMSRYGFQLGLSAFRESVVRYMDRRFALNFEPQTEVLPLIGSKEGLAHLAMATLNPGDMCVIPDPGYPAYVGGATFARAEIEFYPLRAEENFLVEVETLGEEKLSRTKLVYLNYPNNPTGAVAPADYLQRTVGICREHGILLAYDNPYVELTYDDYVAPSIFEIDGARDVAIEFHSFSKSFGMTGWRLGWACGAEDLLAPLKRTKTYMDTGPFLALQAAGAKVLDNSEQCLAPVKGAFTERRTALVETFRAAGFDVEPPAGAMYVWLPLPSGVESASLAQSILETEGVAVLPGTALGAGGEGYVRLSLACSPERLREAVGRLTAGFRRLGIAVAA